MTEKDQHLINELKQNVRRLIESLESEKQKIVELEDQYKGLEFQLEAYKLEHEALKKRYENLKVAKALSDGDPDNQAAKLKINRIVKEIDKCIALLNH